LAICFSSEKSKVCPSDKFLFFFTDDTNIIHHTESGYFQNSINDTFASLKKWFKANQLTLSFDKINFMEFASNKTALIYIYITTIK
jgi:hypothetical protein